MYYLLFHVFGFDDVVSFVICVYTFDGQTFLFIVCSMLFIRYHFIFFRILTFIVWVYLCYVQWRASGVLKCWVNKNRVTFYVVSQIVNIHAKS